MKGTGAMRFVYTLPAGPFVHSPGIGRARAARKWTAEGDHQAHVVRALFGQLPGVNTPKTPADKADLATGASSELTNPAEHLTLQIRPKPEISAQAPTVHIITMPSKEIAQRPRRDVSRHQARQDQYRMSVTARSDIQKRKRACKSGKLVQRARFEEQHKSGWRLNRLARG